MHLNKIRRYVGTDADKRNLTVYLKRSIVILARVNSCNVNSAQCSYCDYDVVLDLGSNSFQRQFLLGSFCAYVLIVVELALGSCACEGPLRLVVPEGHTVAPDGAARPSTRRQINNKQKQ